MTALRRFGLLAPLAALSLAGCGLNSVPTAEEQVNAAWGNLQSEYQRRSDLIPNLVATVQGYAKQERDVLIEMGPGKVLTNLIKRIAPEATAIAMDDVLAGQGIDLPILESTGPDPSDQPARRT